jgi:hypothetical protein
MLGMTRGRTAVCIAIGAMVTLAPGIARAGTWLAPTPIDVSTGSDPSLGLDATGNAILAWRTNPLAPAASVVQGAHHAVGATGFPALAPFSTDTTPMHFNTSPVVVTNRSGNGLVVWVDDQGGGLQQLQLRTISPGGVVGPVVSVPSGGAVGSVANPSAAIDASGDAVVAWEEGTAIDAITRQGLGSFTNTSVPDQLATASFAPAVAIDGAGNAIAMWDSIGGQIDAKRHPAGGAWTATADALVPPAPHVYSDPTVAANPNGQMVVAFVDFDGFNDFVSAVSGSVSGGWGPSPTVTVRSQGGVIHGPGVSVDDGGGAAIGWTTATGVQVSLRPAGGSFPAPTAVQSITPVPIAPTNFFLAGNGRGDVVVAWSSFETTQQMARAAVKPAGTSAFSATQIISDPNPDPANYAGPPVIALDENGDAAVAYPLGATPAGIATAVYDGAGPLLGTPTSPATAVQSTAAAFSVPQPLDAFSAVASVKWSFGDGSADATGTQVSHAYSAAGTFKVTVTATDAVGNASSATRDIVVTAAPPPAAKCKVPKLKGKSLSKAKSLLKKSHCKLGKVTKPKKRKHHKLGKLVVKSSSPKAGATKPAGTKVALKLAPAPKKHHKKKK